MVCFHRSFYCLNCHFAPYRHCLVFCVGVLSLLYLLAKEAIPLRGPLVHNRGFLLMFPLMSLELLTSFAVVIFSVKVLSADTPGGDNFLMMNGIAFFYALGYLVYFCGLNAACKETVFKQPDSKVHLQLIRIQYVRMGLWTLRAILMVLSVVQKA